MQPIKPIRNEADYDLALQEIDRCLDAVAGSLERDRLDEQATSAVVGHDPQAGEDV